MTSSRTGPDGGNNCRIRLNQILAIILRKEGCQGDPGDFWMYENGYLLFQGLLSSNSVCWWNNALNGATKNLVYYGYVNPGALLVGAEPCALEVLRNAWARRVLQPPPGYQIVALEDIEYCSAIPVPQTQWTPLPEAVCAVVLKLSSQGRPAGIGTIREALILTFPHVSPPGEQALYDTLVQLTKERKLYNTSNGYYIVTPEKKRSRSQSNSRRRGDADNNVDSVTNKIMLMSTEEAMAMVHGDMSTIRDGNVTHQCIQTNLADVICGGNASDKILYPRIKRRSTPFPVPRGSDGRGSFRLWSSSRRLRRSASTRTIHKHYVDTSSSTEYPNSGDSTPTPRKESLLSRIFRRSKRSQCQLGTFGGQFPPSEWFNSKAVHLHCVGTQTSNEKDSGINMAAYLETCDISSRSATLPRHHKRQLSSDATIRSSAVGSRDHSPLSRFIQSSYSANSLPRKHGYKSRDSSRKASRSSLGKASSNNLEPPKVEETPVDNKESQEQAVESTPGDVEERLSLASQKYNGNFSYEEPSEGTTSSSPTKHLASIDNSGPSSIESHRSSKTGSSLTSGPSSLESHKTVINRTVAQSPKIDSKCLRKHRKDKDSIKTKTLQRSSPATSTTSSMTQSNSFTVQVTTKHGGTTLSNSNASATATINGGTGSNTKIFVQNSPVRSVITFENGQTENPNVVIINGDVNKKNTNKDSNVSLNNAKDDLLNSESMNNSRKLSLQIPSKDNLNFHNLIKNVSSSTHNQYISSSNPDSPVANTFREFSKNSLYNSNPSSPTKSYEGIPIGKFFKNDVESKTENCKMLDKNFIGSEPNICCKEKTLSRENSKQQFPSLSDLSFNFTSLAAQKILKGVSINSVDTLVELSMAANNAEKQNNCDVVHTDFGMF